jgi:ribosomal protein S1
MDIKKALQERQRIVAEAKRRMPSLSLKQLKEQAARLKSQSTNVDNKKKRQLITDEEVQRILNKTYGCDSI